MHIKKKCATPENRKKNAILTITHAHTLISTHKHVYTPTNEQGIKREKARRRRRRRIENESE